MHRLPSPTPAAIVGLIAIALALIVAVVQLAGSSGPNEPTPAPSDAPVGVSPSVRPSPSASEVASSHLAFQRNDDGGFSAEFEISRDGVIEARQIGRGFPNWIYQVGPGVAIRMTDDEGRLHFAPQLTCADPERQADMRAASPSPFDGSDDGSRARYDATLTVTQRGDKVSAELRLQTDMVGWGSASIGWSQAACEDADAGAIDPAEEARLLALIPDVLTIDGFAYTFERSVSATDLADGESGSEVERWSGLESDDLADIRVVFGHTPLDGSSVGQTLIWAFSVGPDATVTADDLLAARRAAMEAQGCIPSEASANLFDCSGSQVALLVHGTTLYEITSPEYAAEALGAAIVAAMGEVR